MDAGYRSPLVDFFRRGEVGRDIRLLAAQGALAPAAHEQLALLVLLTTDSDPDIATTAGATIDLLPEASLRAFLARADVPAAMREFFAARGIVPAATPGDSLEPLIDTAGEAEPAAASQDEGERDAGESEENQQQALSTLPIVERMKLAMKGTRTQRALLIRDPNKMVSAAVLSSPKLTDSEVEAFAKMANVSEDVLRIIAHNRSWTKNYVVVAALARNPKTPPAVSMQLVQRLNDRDLKALSNDRNVPEAVRLVARKFVVKALK